MGQITTSAKALVDRQISGGYMEDHILFKINAKDAKEYKIYLSGRY